MTETTWRVWFERDDGSTDVYHNTFYDERKAEDYAEWLEKKKHITNTEVVETTINLHP